MSTPTIALGIALIVVGAAITVRSGSDSITSLIPAFVGVLFLVLGLVARWRPTIGRHLFHAAAALALLLVLGSVGTLVGRGAEGWALASQVATIVLCGAYLVLAIRSFVAARGAREA